MQLLYFFSEARHHHTSHLDPGGGLHVARWQQQTKHEKVIMVMTYRNKNAGYFQNV